MRAHLCISVILLVALLSDSAIAQDKGEEKNEDDVKYSMMSLTTCLGTNVDLRSHLQPQSVQSCLVNKLMEVMSNMTTPADEKAVKKQEKKRRKFEEKIKKKCSAECEWTTLGLIPRDNGRIGNVTDSQIDGVLKLFPKTISASLRAPVKSCVEKSPILEEADDKNAQKRNVSCSNSEKLVKCLYKSIRKACKGKSRPTRSTPMASSTASVTGGAVRTTFNYVTASMATSPATKTFSNGNNGTSTFTNAHFNNGTINKSPSQFTNFTSNGSNGTFASTAAPGTTPSDNQDEDHDDDENDDDNDDKDDDHDDDNDDKDDDHDDDNDDDDKDDDHDDDKDDDHDDDKDDDHDDDNDDKDDDDKDDDHDDDKDDDDKDEDDKDDDDKDDDDKDDDDDK